MFWCLVTHIAADNTGHTSSNLNQITASRTCLRLHWLLYSVMMKLKGDVHVTTRRVRVTVVVQKFYLFWMCVCICRYPACKAHAPYYVSSLARPYFFQIISQTVWFSKKKNEHKMCVWFSLHLFLSETIFILRSIQRDTVKNVYWSSCIVPVILVRF